MKVKIDFGRILPGLLLAVAGLVILVILLLVAVVAFLFSFITGFGTVVSAAVALLLVPAVLIAAGVITVLTGVAWWGPGGGWSSGWAARRATKDLMRIGERVGEIVGAVIAIIIFLFLYANQLRGAAFFAPSFGSTAEFYFYGPLAFGIVLSLARAMYGHRNAIRPFDCLNALFTAVAAYWLLASFPFDFTQFGGMFPPQIQFLFGWLNDDIGRILFVLGVAASLVNLVYTAVLYSSVRGQLKGPVEGGPR